jgi:hypothetical protein
MTLHVLTRSLTAARPPPAGGRGVRRADPAVEPAAAVRLDVAVPTYLVALFGKYVATPSSRWRST